MNAIRGLPTDEDIRKTYFWECRRLCAKEVNAESDAKRRSRLQRLWKAQWHSPVTVLTTDAKGLTGRRKVFAIIQGHRFLWWDTLASFDNGEEPSGSIFLAGHAGLATPSPLELRNLDKDEIAKVTSIFGRGASSQEKLTLIAASVEGKELFERAVAFATSAKKD